MRLHRTLVIAVLALGLAGCGEPPPPQGPEATAAPQVAVLSDNLALLNGLTVKGRMMRDSELGHPAYDDALAGEPMARVGERWLALFDVTEQFLRDDVLHGERRDGAGTGPAGLADFADATYLYHMHHSGGRFEDHGLFDALTHGPGSFLGRLSRTLMTTGFEDGRFQANGDPAADMAHGLDAFHGQVYAWVRWHKPDGADDMGALPRAQLAGLLGQDRDEALDVARALAATLDRAWDDSAGGYDLGSGATWGLAELGSLVRGHKGLYELLWIFGDENDRALAAVLFERAATLVAAILDDSLVRPWGLPAQVLFEDGRALAASDQVNVAAQWRFIHHLTGGFAFTREREGTSKLMTRTRPELDARIGRAIDTLLMGALEYQLGPEGVVARLDFGSGEIIDGGVHLKTVSAFVMGAGNSYRAGEAFDHPEAWPGDEALARRSRALYDAILGQGRLLTEVLPGPERTEP